MNDVAKSPSPHRLAGTEHWTTKEGNVKLFLWNKCEVDPAHAKGIILFVHGSSMASQPTFDLDVPGRPDRSEEHTSELQSRRDLVCRLVLEKKKEYAQFSVALLLSCFAACWLVIDFPYFR